MVLSYNMYKKHKNNINKEYSDMGNIFSKLVKKVNDYKKEREKRKILKIYQEVFYDDEEIMGFINEGGVYEI
jgi:uncharacterized coiled-coil DUF342 family protein|tara:strand:- start:1494 stop:1709 length:216 start_codon:yes stop_codon:yes gene_type:complete